MSFENGYNIKDYIEDTIQKYELNSNIFDKAIAALHIFMKRNDWPLCFKEYEKAVEPLIGNPEFLCRTLNMFKSQSEYNHPELEEWRKDLSENFINDAFYFSQTVSPIIESYYSYMNNPLGMNRIIEIDNYSPFKILRLERIDGEKFDIRVSNYDIEQLILTLKGFVGER